MHQLTLPPPQHRALTRPLCIIAELNASHDKIADLTRTFYLDDETVDDDHPIAKAMFGDLSSTNSPIMALSR